MRLENPPTPPSRQTITLPFVVRRATSPEDLCKVTQMRSEAYGRHLPAFAARLRTVEDADRGPGVVVLLAESKDDGRPVGTVRLQVDHERALPIEASVILPAWLRDAGPIIEATRLGVEASECGALARNALLKASYLYSVAAGTSWIVAAARRPLDRLYQGLLFRDVFEGGPLLPMQHIGELPHRVLALPVREARALSMARGHPLAAHFFETEHPDLIVDAAPLRARVLTAA
ncbi:MAG: hypothetical protein JNJ89_19160 [Rubrivivax sp.]|nr:hypothetical protein [Rubrivivax sp.]